MVTDYTRGAIASGRRKRGGDAGGYVCNNCTYGNASASGCAAHEQSYVEYLKKAGLDVVRIDGVEVTSAAAADTLAAMQRGVSVIVQAALAHQGWNGRADILRRIEVPSAPGGWSYEPIDTKLARETKAGTILQLCLYADPLAAMQGLPPESLYVITPWSEFQSQQYRFADYAAYFRKVKAEDLLDEPAGLSGLIFAGEIGGTAKAPIHRYRFPPQETEFRGGEELCNLGGAKLGKVEAISFADNTVDIKKRQDTAGLHPQAVFAHSHVSGQVMADALVRIGDYVADHGGGRQWALSGGTRSAAQGTAAR